MAGLLLAFWATPTMTVGHLVFAASMSIYILVGIRLEERDLLSAFSTRYETYRRDVPALIPRPGRRLAESETQGRER
jgi:protein-S-isoprenylcysteine O-methyltransferase Ste14